MYKKFFAFHLLFGVVIFYLWYYFILQNNEAGATYKAILQIILIIAIFAGYAVAGMICRECKKVNMFIALALTILAVYELQILYVSLAEINSFIIPLYSINGSWHTLARSVIGIISIKNPAIEQNPELMGVIHAIAGLLPPMFTVLGMCIGNKMKSRQAELEKSAV